MSNQSRIFFFFNDTATTEIYTLSLHDALPICRPFTWIRADKIIGAPFLLIEAANFGRNVRSEEHTSELQSQSNLVCRLLLEKKKQTSSDFRNSNPPSGHSSMLPSQFPAKTSMR